MAKTTEKPETKAETPSSDPPASPEAAGGDPPQQQRQQVKLDDKNVTGSYANFCRVTGTPEELIIDFGLKPQPFGQPTEPLQITERIITNYYTAKRLVAALHMTLQRHEAAFGVLEIDVQKRVQPAAQRQPAPAP